MKDYPLQWIHSRPKCRDVAEWATDYLEDRLPALTTTRIGLHLAACAGCRSYVVQIGLVSSTLRSFPTLYPAQVNRLHLHQQFVIHHSQSLVHEGHVEQTVDASGHVSDSFLVL
jgi:hypothetical protein